MPHQIVRQATDLKRVARKKDQSQKVKGAANGGREGKSHESEVTSPDQSSLSQKKEIRTMGIGDFVSLQFSTVVIKKTEEQGLSFTIYLRVEPEGT